VVGGWVGQTSLIWIGMVPSGMGSVPVFLTAAMESRLREIEDQLREHDAQRTIFNQRFVAAFRLIRQLTSAFVRLENACYMLGFIPRTSYRRAGPAQNIPGLYDAEDYDIYDYYDGQ